MSQLAGSWVRYAWVSSLWVGHWAQYARDAPQDAGSLLRHEFQHPVGCGVRDAGSL